MNLIRLESLSLSKMFGDNINEYLVIYFSTAQRISVPSQVSKLFIASASNAHAFSFYLSVRQSIYLYNICAVLISVVF